MKDASTLAVAAAKYLDADFPVIALSGKQPNSTWHKHGLHDAITGKVETEEDGQLLLRIFGAEETTGIGLPIPAHLVVVDIDGEEGAQQWRDLVGDENLTPHTPTAKTGRGLHMWFITPRELGSRKLGPKLDLKGIGGYVAAPPSRHPDGHTYEWLEPLVVYTNGRYERSKFEWLPDPIERLLDVAESLANEAGERLERPIYNLYDVHFEGGQLWMKYEEGVAPPLDGLAKAVREAEEGNRNNLLAWAVLQARDEGAIMEDVLREIGGAALEARLTDREVMTTIRSAYRRGRRG